MECGELELEKCRARELENEKNLRTIEREELENCRARRTLEL